MQQKDAADSRGSAVQTPGAIDSQCPNDADEDYTNLPANRRSLCGPPRASEAIPRSFGCIRRLSCAIAHLSHGVRASSSRRGRSPVRRVPRGAAAGSPRTAPPSCCVHPSRPPPRDGERRCRFAPRVCRTWALRSDFPQSLVSQDHSCVRARALQKRSAGGPQLRKSLRSC